jgi:hypothetical protein
MYTILMKIQKRTRKSTKALRKVKNDGMDGIILWFVIPTALATAVFLFRKQLGIGIPQGQGVAGSYSDSSGRTRKA